jgi:hypothetical protein
MGAPVNYLAEEEAVVVRTIFTEWVAGSGTAATVTG